jgi:predicted ATP-dependent protease
MNEGDVFLGSGRKNVIDVIPASNLREVLEQVLVDCPAKKKLLEKMRTGKNR